MAPVVSRGGGASGPVSEGDIVIKKSEPSPLLDEEPLKVNPKLLAKLKEALSDASYREMVESTANVNTRIAIERKIRLPFLDQQTNLAQTHSCLSYSRLERLPPRRHGQLVCYPATSWYKKKRQYLLNDRLVKLLAAKERGETLEGETTIGLVDNSGSSGPLALPPGGIPLDEDDTSRDANSGPGATAGSGSVKNSGSHHNDESNHSWLRDQQQEFMDIEGEYAWEEPESDYDDDRDDSYGPGRKDTKRKSSANTTKGSGRGGGRGGGTRKGRRGGRSGANSKDNSDKDKDGGNSKDKDSGNSKDKDSSTADDKPFVCDMCGAKYKTRPGLSYHYTHTHGSRRADTPSPGARSTSPAGAAVGREDSHSRQGSSDASPLAGLRKFQDNFLSFLKTDKEGGTKDSTGIGEDAVATPPNDRRQNYCDFCLGSESENKKTNKPEEMVSCADCGRSGHPSCLQFTDSMTANVKNYRWQCIECKTCTLCGTSENDDQLLFCDDCDRGYHMYCLSPPLAEPPEGSWSCHLCQMEATGVALHTAAQNAQTTTAAAAAAAAAGGSSGSSSPATGNSK